MKRAINVVVFLLALCIAEVLASAINVPSEASDWKKAKNNSWPGVVNEQTYWYKLDGNAKLLWSPDGKKWEADSDGMWADKEGSFFKIDSGKLVWSPDAGNTWNDTPEWKWLAVDGLWYKLDKDWIVWVQK